MEKALYIRPFKTLANEDGVLTVDFLFSFVLVMGFSVILFSLTLTLTAVEVAQYMTFASARAQNAAHHDPEAQNKIAIDKFQEIRTNPVLNIFFGGNWFTVSSPDIDDHSKIIPEYASPADGVSIFWGTSVTFTARILDIQIPFFGSTAPESDGSGAGFTTRIGSYLGREVTSDHCYNRVVTERWNSIRNLEVPGGVAPYTNFTQPNTYIPISDNGC